MIQQMLAIWSLVLLPFLKLAWTSGSSWFTHWWSLAWRILSITLLACAAAAAAKSLQSCPTLCDPIGGSPPGSAVPGILQARTLACEMSTIVWLFKHSLALPFFRIGMKTDLFQSCGHCWVFQMCWHIECSTLTASSFRIWNSSTGIPSPSLALFVVMLSKATWLHIPGCLALGEWSYHRDYLGWTPLKARLWKTGPQSIPLLWDRAFLIVRKGPSRIYKPLVEVTSFSSAGKKHWVC